MGQQLSLDDVRRALTARDPELATLLINLCGAKDEPAKGPVREGALTYESVQSELGRWSYRRKKPQERARWRIDVMRALEASDAEVKPPERIGAHAVLMELWAGAQRPGAAFERESLLAVIAGVSLRWGPWRALKQIFKEAEAAGDTEVLGALAARFDAQLSVSRGRSFSSQGGQSEVTRATLAYLCRRAWRFLRRRAEALPAAYADAAVDVLRFYPQSTNFNQTWVYNHILLHETKKYNRRRFRYWGRDANPLKHRAYGDLWRRTPRPLFTLLERANSEVVRGYATSALKTDFRAMLRDVEPAWVVRLIAAHSSSIDSFVIWLLANVPKFEQSAFRELGLHDAVIRLLDSPSSEARAYAAAYARTHARDLPLERLILLANNSHSDVRNLVKDLLGDRDARKDVGLDAWGRLLGTQYGHDLATAALRKHFGARELTREWFSARLLDSRDKVVDFAAELLPKIHTYKDLGSAYYRALLDAPKLGRKATHFALDAVSRFPIADFDADFWCCLLLRSHSRSTVIEWIRQDKVAPAALGTRFWKALAFRPIWETGEPWLDGLKKRATGEDANIPFNDELSTLAFSLLGDVRKFTPDQLGFDWLMLLVQRAEPAYHDFATEYMIKAFLPADFAPADEGAAAPAAAEAEAKTIDLGGKSFLFTGKLATMKRDEAEAKVTAAGGANAGSVTAKLDYLVIGDEGSPLYGGGRKGSKQVAAEKLIAKGAGIKIISETAFLQMLSGGVREFKADKVEAGCKRLWEMLTDPGPVDAPLARFARAYIRRHHPDIGLAETDRPVDPGAEVPASFLTWERVKPLFADERAPLRSLAIELARWELAAWAPALFDLVALAESPHAEVRAFVQRALTVEDAAEHKRFRVPPERLSGDAVYAFCESQSPEARALGMQLIQTHPRLRIPEELFRLSESPDRSVTAFVVRTLWSLYRDRGTTEAWVPPPHPPRRGLVQEAGQAKQAEDKPEGIGAPGRPTTLPASHGALRDFMRRLLFQVPPAKPPTPPAEGEGKRPRRVKPQPARKAKLALIEVMRDLAIAEREFAGVVAPLIKEFMGSRGQSERSACLVALARVAQSHADLDLLAKEVA